MKIYTEEQVIKAHKNGRNGGHNETWHETDEYLNSLTPIELPSDEEILYTGQNHAQKMHKNDAMITFRKYSTDDFKAGAKWVIEQIKQQGDGRE